AREEKETEPDIYRRERRERRERENLIRSSAFSAPSAVNSVHYSPATTFSASFTTSSALAVSFIQPTVCSLRAKISAGLACSGVDIETVACGATRTSSIKPT